MPQALKIPTLQTARLRLRAPDLGDLDHALAMWRDPEVVRYLGGKAYTREETWARLLRLIGHWCALGYGYWVAETRPGGRFVGVVGFGDFRRDMAPNLDGVPEMGWVLAPGTHGSGLATEAGRAALAWRDTALPRGETVCIIDAENAASMRVAAKLGFAARETTTYHDKATVVLARPPPI